MQKYAVKFFQKKHFSLAPPRVFRFFDVETKHLPALVLCPILDSTQSKRGSNLDQTKIPQRPIQPNVMKTKLSFSLLAAAFACGVANAQTAYTTPVGYTTTTISAAFGPGNPKNNVIAPNLQNAATFTGKIASISGDSLTLTGAAFTVGGFTPPTFPFGTGYSYFIETADGYWSHIASNTATAVTVETGAGANFVVDETITIRRHLTISDIFGANNEAGLLADSGGDTGTADNILLIDEINGGTITIIPSDAIGGSWITDAFDDAGNFPVYPEQGIQVLRRGADPLALVTTGEVDTNGRQIEITTGVQVRPFVIPVDVTLGELNLYTGSPVTGLVGSPSGDSSEADTVVVINNGLSTVYFYSEVDLTGDGPGWYDDSLNFASTPLPAGSGLVINRSNPTNSNPFIWTIPAVVIGN